MGTDKHDFREETHLNAAEYLKLKKMAEDLGISKSAVLRQCVNDLGNGNHLKETDAALLGYIAAELNLSKKEALSLCINAFGADLMRSRLLNDTETLTVK